LGGTYKASTVKVKDGKGFSNKVVLTKGDRFKQQLSRKLLVSLIVELLIVKWWLDKK
jgi:hypothetical protein